jgi:type I restriction enzyme S subunit
MSSEWASRSLGEFVRLQRGHDLTASEQRAGSIPVMGSAGPNGTHSEALAKGPGLVIGRSGASIGRVHFSEVDYWPHNTCLYVTDFLGNNARFAYYLLQTLNLAGYNSGSAQPSLNRNFIYSIRIQVPARCEQDEIAHLLNSLDNRIALLRETNATVEAIAKALFKSWFVDFDPVRAKQQGLSPVGMDDATAALFPDSFEESRQGSIPKGWKATSIYDVAQVIYGAPFASGKFNSEGIGRPLVRIRDLRDESPGVYTPEVHPKGYVIKPGDVVVGMDGEFRAYLWGGEEAWLNQRVCVFAPKAEVPAAFLRSAIEPQLAHIEATETATTVIHLGKGDIDRFAALVPSSDVMAAFAVVADPLYARIVANKQTARTLATLRDTLLPRLISGQIRLAPAQEAIAEATHAD